MVALLLGAAVPGLTWSLSLDFISKVVSSTAWPIAAVVLALLFHKEIRRILAQVSSLKAAGVEAEFRDEVANMGLLAVPASLDPLLSNAGEPPVEEPVEQGSPEEQQASPDLNDDARASPPDVGANSAASGPLHAAHYTDPESPIRDFITTIIRWQRATDEVRARQLQSLLDVGGPETVMRLKDARDMAEKSPSSAVQMAWAASEPAVRNFLDRLGFTGGSVSHWMREAFNKGLVAERVYDRFRELKKLRDSVAHAAHVEGFSGNKADVLKYIGRVEDFIISIGVPDRIAKMSDGV